MVEPYLWSASSVINAGNVNTSTLRNIINRDSSVVVVLVDRNHPRIDYNRLMLLDPVVPRDVHLGSATIEKMYLGSTEVSAAYLGDTRIF